MSDIRCTDLLGWLRVKIADAEKAVKIREQMETTWRGGYAQTSLFGNEC